jgi:hypothetical protein
LDLRRSSDVVERDSPKSIPELVEILCQKPGTRVVLYKRRPSGTVPAGISVVVSENTVMPEERTVKVDFAEIGESDKKVTVGSMLCRGRGC